MAEIDFPPALAARQDSSMYSRAQTDNTIKSSMESGKIHTRPRTTRPPKKIFTTGFTDITQAEILAFESFFDIVGTHQVFNWTDPTSIVTYEVRFGDKPPPADYIGMGGTHRYVIGPMTLQQA